MSRPWRERNRRSPSYRTIGPAIVALALSTLVLAPSTQAEPTVIVAGLDTPSGIAIRPDWFEIYVSEAGAGRVVRVVADRIEPAIVGFTQANLPWLPARAGDASRPVGPLGLCFVSRDLLAVGQSGSTNDTETITVYELPRPAPTDDPLAEGTSDQPDAASEVPHTASVGTLGPVELPALRGKPPVAGWGDFWSLAAEDGSVYAAAQDAVAEEGKATRGGIAFARFRSGEQVPLTTFLKLAADQRPIRSVALSPDGHLVAATSTPDATTPSTITFYHARTGKQLLKLEIALPRLVAIAFHPDTGSLYALSTGIPHAAETPIQGTPAQGTPAQGSPHQGNKGQLYRLDSQLVAGKQVLQAIPLESLDYPTAMAFRAGGELYVTVRGTESHDPTGAPPTGAVLRIDGLK